MVVYRNKNCAFLCYELELSYWNFSHQSYYCIVLCHNITVWIMAKKWCLDLETWSTTTNLQKQLTKEGQQKSHKNAVDIHLKSCFKEKLNNALVSVHICIVEYLCAIPLWLLLLGCYSETGFHFGIDRNFVCLWRRHDCRSQVIDLSLSALISWFMKPIIGVLNNSNFHAIISALLIINLH